MSTGDGYGHCWAKGGKLYVTVGSWCTDSGQIASVVS